MNLQRGFSLVGVLVAMALLTLLTAGALTMINNMTASVTFSESSLEATNQIYLAKAVLANTQACTENFKTVNLSTGSVSITHLLKNFDPSTNALTAQPIFPIDPRTTCELRNMASHVYQSKHGRYRGHRRV